MKQKVRAGFTNKFNSNFIRNQGLYNNNLKTSITNKITIVIK